MPGLVLADRAIGHVRTLVRRLTRHERGAAMPIMVAGLIPVLAGIGSAVDIGRLYIVKAQMQAGVDAAALAGARAFGNTTGGNGDRDNQVRFYFDENFSPGFLGADAIIPDPLFDNVRGVNVTTVTARTDLPMLFMKLFGIQSREVEVSATAELQPKPIEVMVVLDDTGSMQTKDVGGGSRMDALKAAMLNFNTILHQGADRRAELAMGFVTYNVSTNVGQILKDHGVEVEDVDGFTNIASYTGGHNDSRNPLGWRGCVDNDATIPDVSSNATVFEDGAWDVSSSLPGEMVKGKKHPAVRPYLYPPVAELQSTGYTYNANGKIDGTSRFWPQHQQTTTSDGRTNNHYLLSPGGDKAVGQRLANTAAYRRHLYNFYVGLNKGTNDHGDDVVVKPGGGYYNPDKDGDNFEINYSRIPYIDDSRVWAQPNAKYGYPLNYGSRTGATLQMSSPNWQCPEPAMMIEYGRAKSDYDDYIRYQNYPVMPASGTLHHIGMLWGYRILSRDKVFTRTNPIPNYAPLKALVFMTDGQTATGGTNIWSGAYGRLADKRIATNTGQFASQLMRRFAKVCQAAKNDGIVVYIVSLKAAVSEFQACAGSRYYQTDSADTINRAFEDIAVDLVDLHLTR